jgi:anti-anti-sigma regulatory factor
MRTATQTVTDQSNKLEVEKVADATITCLRFRGTINEQFEGKKLASQLKTKILVLDMADVQKISSFGIREWTQFMSIVDKTVPKTYVVGASPKVINQLSMVANFMGKAQVFSFYAPYRCDYCEADRLVLLNVDRDRDSIKKLKAPERACETCGNPEYFDEDPVAFFTSLASQPDFELDARVTTFLISKLSYAVSDLARRIQADKVIDGRNTFLRVVGNLDSSFPRDKLAEGLEGTVVLEVSGIGTIDPPGAAEFRRFLSMVSAAADRVVLVGCQPTFLDRATRPEDLGEKVQVLSFAAPYSCEKCQTTTSQPIDVEKHYEVLKIAMPPQLKCHDCGGPTTCVATNTLLSHLRNFPKPTIEPAVRKFIKKAEKQQKKKAVAPGQQPAGVSRTVVVSAAVAAVAVAVMGGLLMYQQQEQQEQVAELLKKSTQDKIKRPPWITSDTPFSGYCTDLNVRTQCVGVSSYRPTKEEARTEAEDAALEALANTVGLKIESALFGQLVRNTYGDARRLLLAELEQDTAAGGGSQEAIGRIRTIRSSVSRALEKTGGAAVPSQIADWYWEQYEAGPDRSEFLAFVRYDISTDAMRALVNRYSQPVEVAGVEVLTAFPSIAWSNEGSSEGVYVVSMKSGPLEKLGLKEKDIILTVRDQPVLDAEDFSAKAKQELASLKDNGNKLKMSFKRGKSDAVNYDGPVEKGALVKTP